MSAQLQEPDFAAASALFAEGMKLQREQIKLEGEAIEVKKRSIKLHREYLSWLGRMKEAMRV